MRRMTFANAIESALAQAMAEDPRIIIFGEDVRGLRRNLFVRFGEKRVRSTPISEAAFVGAAVAAAMGGLRPVVEVLLVDFISVAMDALLNHAAKIETFSGGKWQVPLVLRASCGGGYGDGGQHEQSLWGWLAHIPGLTVVVPSNPADAGGLMLSAIEHPGPVVYLEHKMLADYWLEAMGIFSRETVSFDVPANGASGLVPGHWSAEALGKASVLKVGDDITLVSVGMGVHHSLAASELLTSRGISAGVIDLRSISPLDKKTVCAAVEKTNAMIVVDEDYQAFGLSGELAAVLLETGLAPRYGRVCTQTTIPYNQRLEQATLPNVERIVKKAEEILDNHKEI